MRTGPATGVRLASVLHTIAKGARVDARQVELGFESVAKTKWWREWSEANEQALAPVMDEMLHTLKGREGLPPDLAAFVSRTTTPGAQIDYFFQIVGLLLGWIFNIGQLVWPPWQVHLNDLWSENPHIPLTPAQIATAVVKGHYDPIHAVGEAAKSGLNSDRMGTLIAATGDAPGPIQLGEMFRRSIIDEPRFVRGVQQGLLRTEWAPYLLALKWGPPGAEVAVAAAVQNQLPYDYAKALVGLAGVDPGYFDFLYRTHGRPPGIVEAMGLVHRGAMTLAEFDQVVRESDVKNKYITALRALQVTIPSPRIIVNAVRAGSIRDDVATYYLLKSGYTPDIAASIVGEGHANKTAKHKEIAESHVTQAYELGQIDYQAGRLYLEALGYDEGEAHFILVLADHRREAKITEAFVARVRSSYVRWKIDAATASNDLDSVGIAHEARDGYLRLWDEERAGNRRELTEAQLARLVKNRAMPESVFLDRVKLLGYADDDADYLLFLATGTRQGVLA